MTKYNTSNVGDVGSIPVTSAKFLREYCFVQAIEINGLTFCKSFIDIKTLVKTEIFFACGLNNIYRVPKRLQMVLRALEKRLSSIR